jgi:hypothetical protein
MNVIYDHNDNGLYYETVILAKALARSVNYDPKVCCKLKCTFTIVSYERKTFIAQAIGDAGANVIILFTDVRYDFS